MDDLVTDLVEEVLLGAPTERRALVARLCRENPEHAESIRARLSALDSVGLLDLDAADETPVVDPAELVIGSYACHGLLGSGAIGDVYDATDQRSGHRCALKVLRTEWAQSELARARFAQEGEILARLDHENIARVVDHGEIDGQLFLAMEFVDGPGVDAWLDSLRVGLVDPGGTQSVGRQLRAALGLGPDASPELVAAGLGARAARALEHAHGLGVVHRDLKPSNIMVDAERGVQLVDFGLALDADGSRLTRTGAILGTFAYMSPEQTRGEPCDARSDMFSLGAVLYEMLAHRPPFGLGASAAVVHGIQLQDPPPLSSLHVGASRSFQAVVSKCLEKNPARRYPTAAALAADLEAVVNGEEVRARLPGFRRRVVRTVRRHPARAAAIGVSASLIVALAAVLGFWWANANTLALGEASRQQMQIDDLWYRVAEPILVLDMDVARPLLEQLAQFPSEAPRAELYLNPEAASRLAESEDSPELRSYRAVLQLQRMERGDTQAAMEAYRMLRGVTLARERAVAIDYAAMANAAEALAEPELCAQVANALLVRWPESLSARYWAARAMVHADPIRAEQLFQGVLAQDPDRVSALADLGIAQLVNGRIEDGIDTLESCLERDASNARAALNLGNAYAAAGRLEDSVDALRRAVRCEPTWVGAHYGLSLSLMDLGQTTEAELVFEHILELEPTHREARYQLASIRLGGGTPTDALPLLRSLVVDAPDWAIGWRALAYAEYTLNGAASAASVYEKMDERSLLDESDRATWDSIRGDSASPAEGRGP
ncbi:MAG: protein kinase [Planctomycetota bacterium]